MDFFVCTSDAHPAAAMNQFEDDDQMPERQEQLLLLTVGTPLPSFRFDQAVYCCQGQKK
jgi:hypothetical protein